MEQEQQEVKKDLDQDSTTQEVKDTDTTPPPSDLDTSSTTTSGVESSTDTDTDTDTNASTTTNTEDYDKLNKSLDTEIEKTNRILTELERDELSSLKIPKQSLYKKREVFLKDATDKINSAFKYIVYINKRKKAQ